jgi:hypothetical protein
VVPAKASYAYYIIFFGLTFLDLRVYLHFMYETFIPTCLGSHFSVEGNFLHVPTCIWPSLHSSKSSSVWYAMQHDCPCLCFVRPLCQLEVVTVYSFCVVFKCYSFFGNDLKLWMAMALKRKKLTISEKVKGGGKKSNYVTHWNCKVFYYASIIIKWYNSTENFNSWRGKLVWGTFCETKKLILLTEQNSVPYCWVN